MEATPSLTSQLGDFRELGDQGSAVQVNGIECDHAVAGQGPAQCLPRGALSLQVKVRVQASFQVQGCTGQDGNSVAQHAHAVVENDVVGTKPPLEAGSVARPVQLPDDMEGPAVEHSPHLVDDDPMAFADGLAFDVLQVKPCFGRLVDQGQRAGIGSG